MKSLLIEDGSQVVEPKARGRVRNGKADPLWDLAIAARDKAYAPYSQFKVGAAMEAGSGKKFSGCNVENASYGLTICAERNAIFQAVAAGEKKIRRLVIYTEAEEPTPPCGACRQVLNEFGPKAEVFAFGKNGKSVKWRMTDLLPGAFGPQNLPEAAPK